MNGSGVSLIEVMLSLFLSMMLLVTMNGIWVSLSALNHVKNQHETILQLTIALTRWASDVGSADQVVRSSGKLMSNQCILKVGDTYCGWLVKKGKLMRYAGSYSSANTAWSHLSTSLLMGSLEKAQFRYFSRNEKIVAIQACFTASSHDETSTLKLVCAL